MNNLHFQLHRLQHGKYLILYVLLHLLNAPFSKYYNYCIEPSAQDGRKRIIHKKKPAWLGEARDPPEHGKKPIPKGDPHCLDGLVFVITGLNKYLTAQETSDLIYDHGGYRFNL